jgi:NADPH2:quinone reductase
MKAVRVHGWNQPPMIEEAAEPARVAGRSIVRMAAATVGHIDRTVWSGRFLAHPPLPYIPGVEAAGIVVASDRFAAGQRVWVRGGGLGTLTDGTWCELIAAPDEALGLLPDDVPMALGSAFFSPCTSAWTALHDVARLQRGERLLVTGATGAVGSLTVQLALELGAKVSVDVTSGEAVDALIDTVGGPLLQSALACVVPGGRAVLVGYTAGNELTLALSHFLQRDVSLLPLNMFRREASGRERAPELLARLADGRLRLDAREFALADAAEALEWITRRGHRGRAVLVPDRGLG